MMQPAHEEPPRLLVGAPLLSLHLCDLFGRALRLYRIYGGDDEEHSHGLCGAASRRRSYAAAARRRMGIGAMRPGARVAFAAAARIDQFGHSLFALAIIAAPHLKHSLSPLAGSTSRLRKELSGSFRKFSSMSITRYHYRSRQDQDRLLAVIHCV